MKSLAAALLKVQQELDPVKKGAKGHNNKYADLPAVLDEAVGKLNDNGVVVLQPIMPASRENHARVDTTLIHAESGEIITGSAEVPWKSESRMNDAQSYGSAITYARRYSLVSILSIATEDDDGKSAYHPKQPVSTEDAQRQAKQQAIAKWAETETKLLEVMSGSRRAAWAAEAANDANLRWAKTNWPKLYAKFVELGVEVK